jgi:hypothetical protein
MTWLEICGKNRDCSETCPYGDGSCEFEYSNCIEDLMADALVLLKEQEARIKKYEYLFDFLGIGFREWATKILDGEAEAICEADEHEHKTVITFKLI